MTLMMVATITFKSYTARNCRQDQEQTRQRLRDSLRKLIQTPSIHRIRTASRDLTIKGRNNYGVRVRGNTKIILLSTSKFFMQIEQYGFTNKQTNKLCLQQPKTPAPGDFFSSLVMALKTSLILICNAKQFAKI